MRPSQGAETDHRTGLRVVARQGFGRPPADCQGLRRVRSVLVRTRVAIVHENADVDAHDGHDAAHVQVHHIDTLQQIAWMMMLVLFHSRQ